MRKWSMKKFGTPICAGPGVASEKVGFAGVGAPLACCGGGGAAFFCAGLTRPEPDAWLSALPAVPEPELPVRVAGDDGAFGFACPPELGFGLAVGVGVGFGFGFGFGVGVTVIFGTVGTAVGVAVGIAPRSWIDL